METNKREYKPMYQHDMMHCAEKECKLYNECYRAYLGREMINYGWTTGWFYHPSELKEDCNFFIDKNNY